MSVVCGGYEVWATEKPNGKPKLVSPRPYMARDAAQELVELYKKQGFYHDCWVAEKIVVEQ